MDMFKLLQPLENLVVDELNTIQTGQFKALSSLSIQRTDNHFRDICLPSDVFLK